MKKTVKMSRNRGFTLVELAIVMTIIGLLIGGVIKGQQLIQNARVTSTINQVTAYQAATQTFRDTYGQLPGDMANARSRIVGCTAATFCYNGNGDSIIGTHTGDWNDQTGVNTSPRVETAMYWKHMALANLISGVVPVSDPTRPVWGETHPDAAVGGGFHINHDTGASLRGHFLRLQQSVTGAVYSGIGSAAVSPVLAGMIDRKMDDGKPNTGVVTSANNGGAGWAGCAVGTREYDSVSEKNCIMFFRAF